MKKAIAFHIILLLWPQAAYSHGLSPSDEHSIYFVFKSIFALVFLLVLNIRNIWKPVEASPYPRFVLLYIFGISLPVFLLYMMLALATGSSWLVVFVLLELPIAYLSVQIFRRRRD
jgi:hypothetical protein